MNEQKKYNRLLNISYLISILLIFIGITENQIYVRLFIIVSIFFAFLEPISGYATFIIAYPFFRYFTNITGVVGYYSLIPALIVSSVMQIFKIKGFSFSKKILIFTTAFYLATTVSFLLASHENTQLISYLMHFFSVFVFLMFSKNGTTKEGMGLLFNSYLISSLSILLVNVLTDNFIGAGRLAIGESIRRVSNVVSPAIIIVYIEMLLKRRKSNHTILNNKYSFLQLLLWFSLLVSILLATVSRGSYVAVLITIIIAELLHQFSSQKKLIEISKNFIFIFLAVILFIIFVNLTTTYISGGYMARVNTGVFTTDLRWQIWETAIQQMTPKDIIIGSGPNTFGNLALKGGLDFYAHSVFIDTYVTMGVLGAAILLILFLNIFFQTIKLKNITGFLLSILILFLYSTHGNIASSMDFWALLGLILSTNKYYLQERN